MKIRNWLAVAAHFKKGGPMDNKKQELPRKRKHKKPLIYKTKEMENKLIVKRYKIPEDLLMDILRILFGNNIMHKIIGIQERQNILLLNVNFDLKAKVY